MVYGGQNERMAPVPNSQLLDLAELTEARVRGDAIIRARSADEVPLSTAIGLLARERLSGDAPPTSAKPGLDLVA